jgi:hypothetical protein
VKWWEICVIVIGIAKSPLAVMNEVINYHSLCDPRFLLIYVFEIYNSPN